MRISIIALLALMFFAYPAQAQGPVAAQIATCDTPEQIKKLFALYFLEDKSMADSLKEVNGNEKPVPCGFGVLGFIPSGDIEDRVQKDGMVYGIVKVLVVAYHNGQGFVPVVPPMVQYTIKPLVEESSA